MSKFASLKARTNIKYDLENPILKEYFEAFEKESNGNLKLSDISGFFDMSKRRIFHKEIDIFVETQNNIFEHFPDIIANLLIVKMNIDNVAYIDSEQSINELVDDLHNIINDKELISFIDNLVESTYNITIESGTPSRNVQLQFKDSYCKNCIKAAYLFRLVIPYMAHFMFINNMKSSEFLFMQMIGRIFKLFEFEDDDGKTVDMATKLMKFVESAVSNTLYSDKVIWNYLRNKSITDKTLGIEIHRNIMCYILPKTKLNTSIISFFHVVVTSQIDFQFTSKFKVEYRPIQTTKIDSESSNPFARMEQKLSRSGSEIDNIMMKKDVSRFIRAFEDLIIDYNIDEMVQIFNIHSLQTKLVSFFLQSQLSKVNIYFLDRIEYIKLTLIAEHWFRNNGFTFIADILLSKPVHNNDKSSSLTRKGSKLLSQITSSCLFTKVFNKYAHMGEEIEDSILIKFIGEIVSTEFVSIFSDDDSIVTNPKQVAIEVLEFIDFI